jgi:hypothetical protein
VKGATALVHPEKFTLVVTLKSSIEQNFGQERERAATPP